LEDALSMPLGYLNIVDVHGDANEVDVTEIQT
jgi:hypothetical protein